MRSGQKKSIVGMVLVVLLAPGVYAQKQVGDETTLNLTGSASLGYNRTWDGTSSDDVAYGFNGLLSGVYHDPRFLNYSVSPYLNQSNLNSNFNSNTLASGLNAQANFLSGSQTPMQFSYSRDYNREGTFNVPGSIGSFETRGSGQTASLNAGYLPEDWPSLQGTFVHSSTDYEVLGTPGTGRSHSNLLGVSSTYELWDTGLNGSFIKSWVDSESPAFGAPNVSLTQNTTQDTLQFSGFRRVFNHGNFNAGYSRSHIHGEYAGTNVDSTFDTLTSALGMTLTDKLSVEAHVNYSTNLSAQYFSNIIGGTGAQKSSLVEGNAFAASSGSPQGVSYTSDYLSYGGNVSYRARYDLRFQADIDHRVQGQSNGLPDFTSTIMQAQGLWTHKLFGGSLGAAFGVSYSFTPVYSFESSAANLGTQTATQNGTANFFGNSASVSYGRQFGRWSASASGSYGYGLTTLLVGYTQTTYGGSGAVTRNMKYGNLSLHAGYSKSHVDAASLSDTKTANYGASFSVRDFGISGSYAQSSGNAIQVLGGIVTTPPPGGGPLPSLLMQFNGESYGFGANWRPKRRWNISGTYTHLNYTTINPLVGSAPVRNMSEQYYVRSECSFRQLFLYTGYSYVSQGYDLPALNAFKYNTFYFGVTRYFNFF
jgi:hypothetical protein